MTDYEYPDYCKLDKPLIFDSHAHLDDEKFEPFRHELLTQLPRCGVGKIITCGCDVSSSMMALNLANQYDYIYAAVGIHPQNINTKASIPDIKALALDKRCVAIGEIGLDYYWERDNKKQQIKLFEEQILLAKELDM
ncbi:MAG: TatD family hydrolase, partial [Clostridia bacterium]|nr:TatD family hydrolase [Clostridia bacterium]